MCRLSEANGGQAWFHLAGYAGRDGVLHATQELPYSDISREDYVSGALKGKE